MPLFGSYRDKMRLPSPVVPVDMRELEPLPLTQPGPGEPRTLKGDMEAKAVEEMIANRPRVGLFGGARRKGLPAPDSDMMPEIGARRAGGSGPMRQQQGQPGQLGFADRLFMVGAILNDRPELAMRYRDSVIQRGEEQQRRQAAEQFAERLGGAYGIPQRKFPVGQFLLGGQSGVEAQRRHWKEQDQAQAQGAVAERFGSAYGSGQDMLPELLPDLLRLQAMGVDIGPYAKLIDTLEARQRRDQYLSTVPQDRRPEAALDPTDYAQWDREQRTPSYHAVAPGTSIVGVNRATGTANPLFTSPRPQDPLSTDQLVASVIGKAQRGDTLSDTETLVMNRWLYGTDQDGQRPSPNSVVGAILDKFTRGEQLSPQEEELRGRYMTGTLSMTDQLVQSMLPGLMGGGGAPSAQPPLAPPATQAPPQRPPQRPAPGRAPQGRAGASPQNPVRPKSRAEAQALPAGTWFVDPKGNLLQR